MRAHDGAGPAPVARLDRSTWLIAGVVVLGAIMSILDTTIVNVALETLAREFRVPLTTVQWVATGYLLALAVVIPLAGWAAERFGARRVWMASVALFLAGSMLAGAAWSIESLIAFRVVQGLGGGMIMPVGMALLARSAGPARMGRVMGIVGVPMLLGPVLGPVLGGLLIEHGGWRWIFYVNVPIGALALPLAARLLPREDPAPATASTGSASCSSRRASPRSCTASPRPRTRVARATLARSGRCCPASRSWRPSSSTRGARPTR